MILPVSNVTSYHSPQWPSLCSLRTPTLSWPQCLCTFLLSSAVVSLCVSSSLHPDITSLRTFPDIPLPWSFPCFIFLPCTRNSLIIYYVFTFTAYVPTTGIYAPWLWPVPYVLLPRREFLHKRALNKYLCQQFTAPKVTSINHGDREEFQKWGKWGPQRSGPLQATW